MMQKSRINRPNRSEEKRDLRRDAAENRSRLLEAARIVMSERGGDVPLEAIAKRAGTTRGTMYRNFADRSALYLAVLQDDLNRISTDLSPNRDLLSVIHALTNMMRFYDRFLASLPSLEDVRNDVACHELMTMLIAQPLDDARQKKEVRVDLSIEDVLVVCRMLAADWRLDGRGDAHEALERRLDLILNGLRG